MNCHTRNYVRKVCLFVWFLSLIRLYTQKIFIKYTFWPYLWLIWAYWFRRVITLVLRSLRKLALYNSKCKRESRFQNYMLLIRKYDEIWWLLFLMEDRVHSRSSFVPFIGICVGDYTITHKPVWLGNNFTEISFEIEQRR